MENFLDWFHKWVMMLPVTIVRNKPKWVRIIANLLLIPYAAITVPIWLPVTILGIISGVIIDWYESI